MEKFPTELSQAIEGLNNEHRQNILLKLYTIPKLSFSELVGQTGITDSLISTHLRKLRDSMLIEHFYEHEVGREEYSFYKITKYGRRILNNLFNIVYIITEERELEFIYMRERGIVTSISPNMYDPTDEKIGISDTAERIIRMVREVMAE